MAKYRFVIGMNASVDCVVEAENLEKAECMINEELFDDDAFIDSHRKEIDIWNPIIKEIKVYEEE